MNLAKQKAIHNTIPVLSYQKHYMGRITKKILEEARRMEGAWIHANPDGDKEWYRREIAGLLGVDYINLKRKLCTK